jgi:hypothetical protein
MAFHLAIISTNRPHNVEFMQSMCAPHECHWYVNAGEYEAYQQAGAHFVNECALNICHARNAAIKDADDHGVPCIQISDDLRNIKNIFIDESGAKKWQFIDVLRVCDLLIFELKGLGLFYGGVAVSSNPLNYNGEDVSTNKLIVNDFICLMPGAGLFDENLALKEDYDMSIRQLLGCGGIVRLNNILCDFPHRQNKGGANDYRNDSTEAEATKKLIAKWPNFVRMNPRRPGQVLLNYKAIRESKINPRSTLFDL